MMDGTMMSHVITPYNQRWRLFRNEYVAPNRTDIEHSRNSSVSVLTSSLALSTTRRTFQGESYKP